MKNNAWKKLKKENNRSELNLTVEDIGYVNKVCTHAESHGGEKTACMTNLK